MFQSDNMLFNFIKLILWWITTLSSSLVHIFDVYFFNFGNYLKVIYLNIYVLVQFQVSNFSLENEYSYVAC